MKAPEPLRKKGSSGTKASGRGIPPEGWEQIRRNMEEQRSMYESGLDPATVLRERAMTFKLDRDRAAYNKERAAVPEHRQIQQAIKERQKEMRLKGVPFSKRFDDQKVDTSRVKALPPRAGMSKSWMQLEKGGREERYADRVGTADDNSIQKVARWLEELIMGNPNYRQGRFEHRMRKRNLDKLRKLGIPGLVPEEPEGDARTQAFDPFDPELRRRR